MTANPGRGAKNQVRIRGPKPDRVDHCTSLPSFEALLRSQVEDSRSASVPEVVYSEFIFGQTVPLDVENLPDEWKESLGASDGSSIDLRVGSAVALMSDAKIKLKRQRAVARAVLKSIQSVDGFKYFEKEAWDTKHNDGYRFKFLCRDSYQNKDRAQNKARSSNPSALDFNGIVYGGDDSPAVKDEREFARLPTYDCKGSIFVKFSASQSILDVVYMHLPVHREATLPPPIKRAREGQDDFGLEDEHVAMDVDITPPVPHAPRFSLAAPPTLDFDDSNPSIPRGKRRKRTSLKAHTYKELDSSDVQDESSLNGIDTPEDPDLAPLALSTFNDTRKDWPTSPPRSPDHPLWPDDRAFMRPSVVTRVPTLASHARHAIARQQAYARTVSSDADGDEGPPPPPAQRKERKKPGPKPKQGNTPSAREAYSASSSATATATATTAAAAAAAAAATASSDSASRRRTKTGCWTCRTRKLKCDESRPKCSHCARSRPPRECSYPEESEDPSGTGANSAEEDEEDEDEE